jgi:AMP nucleosidase
MAKNAPKLDDPESVILTVFGCRPEDVAEDVVVTPFVPLKAFRRFVEEPVVELAPPFFYRGFSAAVGDRRVTVVLTGVGPSRVGDCLGFLSLTPTRRVLFAGAVGGLDPAHSVGDFFLPTEAVDGEGFTRYVTRPFEELARSASRIPCPSDGTAESLLRAKGWTVRKGRVFTVGSIVSESDENLRTLARFGYHALEMELSAFYAAADHYGFEPIALTYVSDLPLASPLWRGMSPEQEAALRSAYRALPQLCLEYLCRG